MKPLNIAKKPPSRAVFGCDSRPDDDGGGVAYFGNTTSGQWTWSERLGEKFFARANRHNINGGKDAHFIGLAHAFARGEYCATWGGPQHVAYTCNLGGDPLTAFWTAEPAELAMSYQSSPEGTGYTVDVAVTEGANAVPGARVTLEYIPGRYYKWEPTNEEGHALFYNVPVITAGKLTAWKHNYVPKADEDVNVPGE